MSDLIDYTIDKSRPLEKHINSGFSKAKIRYGANVSKKGNAFLLSCNTQNQIGTSHRYMHYVPEDSYKKDGGAGRKFLRRDLNLFAKISPACHP